MCPCAHLAGDGGIRGDLAAISRSECVKFRNRRKTEGKEGYQVNKTVSASPMTPIFWDASPLTLARVPFLTLLGLEAWSPTP